MHDDDLCFIAVPREAALTPGGVDLVPSARGKDKEETKTDLNLPSTGAAADTELTTVKCDSDQVVYLPDIKRSVRTEHTNGNL